MTAELLQVPDIARLLDCSTRTVYRLIATGQVPEPMRIGNLVRWRRESIDAWVAQGCPTVSKSDITLSTSLSDRRTDGSVCHTGQKRGPGNGVRMNDWNDNVKVNRTGREVLQCW